MSQNAESPNALIKGTFGLLIFVVKPILESQPQLDTWLAAEVLSLPTLAFPTFPLSLALPTPVVAIPSLVKTILLNDTLTIKVPITVIVTITSLRAC
jgi:hypothetical protein